MPYSAMVGKTVYRQEVTRGRNAARRVRNATGQMRQAGETTRLVLTTEIALAVAEILEVFDELDKIGRQDKTLPET